MIYMSKISKNIELWIFLERDYLMVVFDKKPMIIHASIFEFGDYPPG